jgi:hypothetical protein
MIRPNKIAQSLIITSAALPLLLQPTSAVQAQTFALGNLTDASLAQATATAVSQKNSTFTAQPALSNLGSTFIFVLTLKDASNRPVTGKNVDILVSKNLKPATHFARTTDQGGVATITIQSDESGDYIANTMVDTAHFIASAVVTGGDTSAAPMGTAPETSPTSTTPAPVQQQLQTATTTITDGSSIVSQSVSTFTAQPILTTVGSDLIYILTLKDANSNPISGKDVTVLVSKNLKPATRYPRTTDQNGQTSVTITSDEIGDYIANTVVDNAHFIASAVVSAGDQPNTLAQPQPAATTYIAPTSENPQTQNQPTQALQYAVGRLTMNVNQNILTYTDAATQQSLRMWEARWAFNALKNLAITVPDATLKQIPQPGQDKQQNLDLRRTFAGKILISKSDKNKIWYIHPDSLQRYWFNGTASSFTYLKSIADQR